ncbi:MAG: riboflavin synthase [Dehalococcoidales bacterium]|nr:riboflavin synthase [Dehalococcoidales bacterium]
MFTGITEELGKVSLLQPNKLVVRARKVLEGTGIGDSVSVNGACLTIVEFGSDYFSVEVVPETMRRTNLGLLKVGDEVNLERPLALGSRLGGHLVQGHVDERGKVVSLRPEGDAVVMRFQAPREVMRYVVVKGFIAIDGISLTVVERDETSFTVSVIPHTRQNTTLGKRRVGDTVNLEVDIIAKYVEALTQSPAKGVTTEFLQEHGFLVK